MYFIAQMKVWNVVSYAYNRTWNATKFTKRVKPSHWSAPLWHTLHLVFLLQFFTRAFVKWGVQAVSWWRTEEFEQEHVQQVAHKVDIRISANWQCDWYTPLSPNNTYLEPIYNWITKHVLSAYLPFLWHTLLTYYYQYC